ncbi:MAG: radical SAM protein [Desulfurococcales archaeon]|nr:radical SAM protein [Desulfurococcales archaeon]
MAVVPLSVMVTGRGTVSTRIKGRYGPGRPSRFSSEYRPVVFWNITYKCNLRCEHCYIRAGPDVRLPELSVEEVLGVARQIVEHGIPLVVFTGGEPLVSEKFWRAAEYLAGRERPKLSLSTNGTLIDGEAAGRLKRLGFKYVGVSLDSLKPELHDKFRGVRGAWEAAVRGMRASVEAGIPTGLRVTATRRNIAEVPEMIDFAAKLGLSRVSVYLLDTIGRGEEVKGDVPSVEQVKWMVDRLIEKAREYEGVLEILLVRMNYAGIYVADRVAGSREEFLRLLELLQAQGDCGRKTVSIYPDGTVKPCQFIDYYTIGDLRRERLSDILSPRNPRLRPFLEMHRHLRGPRCSRCPFRRICGGGSRNRALVLEGDFWGDDPTCIVDPEGVAARWGLDPGTPL